MNDLPDLEQAFAEVGITTPLGARVVLRLEALDQRRRRRNAHLPRWAQRLDRLFDFAWNRVCPKVPGACVVHRWIAGDRDRAISVAECLGRLVVAGFEIESWHQDTLHTHVFAKKTRQPLAGCQPSRGPVFRMERIGKDGKAVHVLKLRTMHPYSEFLQDYVHRLNHLEQGGKFRDDFRVARWGRWLRRYWLDELPMLWNWARGDLKLVGVRPISRQYASLYPKAALDLRVRFKPGLVPPFYADLPKTIEEIVASERRYLEAYQAAPFRADARYLCRAAANILFRGARSN